MAIDPSALVAPFPSFTNPAGFTDLLVDGSLPEVQLSILEGLFDHEGLTDLSSALALLRDPAGVLDRREFKITVYELVRRDATRIQELLVRAQVSPGTQRFNPDARAVVATAFGVGRMVSPSTGSVVGVTEAMDKEDKDRISLRTQHPKLSAAVAYRGGQRFAVATSREALEIELARRVRTETSTPEMILITNIHGKAVWQKFDFGNYSSRYLGEVAKIREELDLLSDKGFVGFWFKLWRKKTVQRIQDSQNILALNVLEAVLEQYNAGKISYGVLVKVIKALDIITKKEPAVDVRGVYVGDEFYFRDKNLDSYLFYHGSVVTWKETSLPREVRVLVLKQVPLTTP
ncbi:MAG: hypothetical protein HY877_03850 [Deltaproteobacteria bacterium]|nr:hypothetical protein [Deltaproteobacteria bacterium]